MINKSFFKLVVRVCLFLQILIGYSMFNYSVAQSSCGIPNYNRATQDGIYLWQVCTSKEWFMRAVGGGRTTNNELRVEGALTLTKPIQTLTPFSLEPGNPNEQFPEPDFINKSDPKNVTFRFRVWTDGQDGMDFKLPTGATVCLKLSNPPGTPVFVGRAKTQISSPFNLNTLDGSGCSGIMSTLQMLLLQ